MKKLKVSRIFNPLGTIMMQETKDVRIDCKTTIQVCKKIFYYTVSPKQKIPSRIVHNKRMTKQVETL